MLLSQEHPKRFRRERRRLGIGLSALAILAIIALWNPSTPKVSASQGTLVCDAERTNGTHFYNKGVKFTGANYRTTDRAHTGQAALRFPADGQTHFGFSTQLQNVQPGTLYELSVWSFGNTNGVGQLAVQGQNPSGFYQQTAVVKTTDAEGWQQHVLRFHIPFNAPPKDLNLYVYSNGEQEVFFDDLQLQVIDQWQADIFRPTQLRLELDDNALRQLEAKRLDALGKGLLQTGEADWVKAKITADSAGAMSAKVRLKGDWLDHLRGDKWSFRVALKDGHSWRGMLTFNLHTPEARYFLHEWLLHKWWETQDVLTTRYDFVELLVNGESRGIYAYEEHFEKQLIESKDRREGPILKYSEDGYWEGMASQLNHHGFIRPESGLRSQDWENAPVNTFNNDEVLLDTLQSAYAKQGQLLLSKYRDGEASPTEVFDLQQLARYYAGCDLFNAYHGIVWHNQRFYYNPLTALLEPIGFDGFAERPGNRYHFLAEGALNPTQQLSDKLPAQLLQDPAFIREYLNTLWSLSRPEKWTSFWQAHEAAWTARLSWLQLEFPEYQADLQSFAREIAFVRSHILPAGTSTIHAQAYADQVQLCNTHTLPLRVIGYGKTKQGMERAFPSPITLPAAPARRLLGYLANRTTSVAFQNIRYWDANALAQQGLVTTSSLQLPASSNYLYYQLPGLDTLLMAPIHWQATTSPSNAPTTRPTASKPADFPAFTWQDDQVYIPSGEHTLNQDLVLAADQRLQIAPSTTLYLENSAALFCQGAITALGEEELPITITSRDGTGQGLVVLRAPTTSKLRRVEFRGLTNWNRPAWQLTGAVNFIASSVEMTECIFRDNQSEDGLNTVRSEIKVSNSLFSNTSSDGFDSDFCKGIISYCVFSDTANDGLDASGSVLTVQNCQFQNCGDKGISAGEASDLTLKNIEIKDSEIGIASKDQSTVVGKDVVLVDCTQGLVVFQKKPEYGPAFLLTENLETRGLGRVYKVGPGSRLQMDQELIIGE